MQASRIMQEIVSHSRENQDDHVLFVKKKRVHGIMFSNLAKLNCPCSKLLDLFCNCRCNLNMTGEQQLLESCPYGCVAGLCRLKNFDMKYVKIDMCDMFIHDGYISNLQDDQLHVFG